MGIFWFLSGLKHSPRWEWLCKIISVNTHTRSSKMENKIEVVIWYGVMIHVIFVHTLDTKQKNPVAILGYILYFTFPHIWSLPLNTFKC